MELTDIKGIGPKSLEQLNKLNIYTLDDLIRYYPYRYNVYTPSNIFDAVDNQTIIVNAKIISVVKATFFGGKNKLTFNVESSNITFRVGIFNRLYLKPNLTIGKDITLIGKYDKLHNSFTASDIKLRPLLRTEVEPVYHMVSGLKHSTLTKAINVTLEQDINISSAIPNYLDQRYEFINTIDAIREIHKPTSNTKLKQAKIKLKYDELFTFMFKINIIKYRNMLMDNFVIKHITEEELNAVMSYVPFELTTDQISAVKDIYNDFNETKKMNRLLLGDVGSGKTIVGFLSILMNYKCGYQSALLAPTEVLARQHFDNFNKLFSKLNLRVGLLVGSLTKKEKDEVITKLKNNEIDVLIGTHAMLEDNVEFANIGLVITDEQHRFGVNQRKALQNKGLYVDVLYMSATPIPRTYALTIYGDMDISMIKTKPKGRKDIITKTYKEDQVNNYIEQINDQLQEGHQVYVIAPLIEENEESNLNDINKIKSILEDNFKDYSIDILHGKMKAKDKDTIMDNFKKGITNILISTTVIEVGVDVSNATMIVIFNAERFGLATLHQLRGRVGRNELQSYCLLISDSDTQRLDVMCESNDGFYISEKDFEMRGSGDLFGVRQSGDMVFKVADIHDDFKILLQCKKDSDEFIKNNIETNFRDYKYYQNILEELMNQD